jgi:hypothetical protein
MIHIVEHDAVHFWKHTGCFHEPNVHHCRLVEYRWTVLHGRNNAIAFLNQRYIAVHPDTLAVHATYLPVFFCRIRNAVLFFPNNSIFSSILKFQYQDNPIHSEKLWLQYVSTVCQPLFTRIIEYNY